MLRLRDPWPRAALLATALALAAAAPAGAAFPGANGRIAFSRYDDTTFASSAVWTMNPDGSDQRQLTTAVGFDQMPAYSPDGTRIAFATNRDGDFEIYVMNADGSDQKRLTNIAGADVRPTWSPDGKQIAFDSERDSPSGGLLRQIYVMNADGTNQHSVSTGGHDDLAPAWYPNGARIAFYSNESVTAPGALRQLYDVRTDGVDRRQISTVTTLSYQDPSFAPDGSRIAFWSPPAGGGVAAEIFSVVPDGSDVQRRTNNNSVDSAPAWSPDGKQIAFVSNRTGGSDVFVMNADGSDQHAITFTGVDEDDPDWGPAVAQPPPAGGGGGTGGGGAGGGSGPGAVDADHDGVPAPTDCNDSNPAVHPGAPEVPGNAVDENCDGILGQYGHVPAVVQNQWTAKRRYTTVLRLVARPVPRGTRVEVRCRGRGCPFRKKVVRARNGRAVLHPLFRGRRLGVGAVVEVRVTRSQTIGKSVSYTMRAGRLPTSRVRCLEPGRSTPTSCG